ncbi:MAG: redoxin domain-containing protein [Candidatus Micrarchaeota archaeon]|nr:redoxin domain-containing protein [Candidatus Micrarchaeota archaeon]MDE1833918.1 redoxin domain-containing protein [Candidatus Micrarchaeota archaeon]MDE1859806.1 redoxin domain-containing protein [Candidatus Micrarchaeota archaeon]
MVEIGEQIPKVKVIDTEMKQIDISKATSGKAAAGKATVIAFFPGAFTGVCTKEMCTFRDDLTKLLYLNANLYAISVDGPFSNKAFKDHNNLSFPILSDYKKKAIKKFGIVLKDFAHLKGYTAAKRSIFVTDASGIVRYKWVSDDPSVEPNYAEIRGALESINK